MKQNPDVSSRPVIVSEHDRAFNEVALGRHKVVAAMLQYLFSWGEMSAPEEFKRIIREYISPEVEGSVMNMAQRLRQEGQLEGLLAGFQQGAHNMARDAARSLLAAGIDPRLVAKCTKLPLEEVYALREQAPATEDLSN